MLERFTVENFVAHICGICTNHNQKVRIVDLNYVLTEAKTKYNNSDNWLGEQATGQDSEFVAEEVEYWNCRQKGHYARDCPQPRKDNFNRGRQGGRGRGQERGCGGRTRNRREKNVGYDRNSDPQLKPPGKEYPRVRSINDVVEYWCRTCRCWTNHPTDKHVKIALMAQDKESKQQQAEEISKVLDLESTKSGSSKGSSFAAMLTHFS